MQIETLEELRDKNEIKIYFLKNGINLSNKDIENLKQAYNKDIKTSKNLTLKQLEKIAGGIPFLKVLIDPSSNRRIINVLDSKKIDPSTGKRWSRVLLNDFSSLCRSDLIFKTKNKILIAEYTLNPNKTITPNRATVERIDSVNGVENCKDIIKTYASRSKNSLHFRALLRLVNIWQ